MEEGGGLEGEEGIELDDGFSRKRGVMEGGLGDELATGKDKE